MGKIEEARDSGGDSTTWRGAIRGPGVRIRRPGYHEIAAQQFSGQVSASLRLA